MYENWEGHYPSLFYANTFEDVNFTEKQTFFLSIFRNFIIFLSFVMHYFILDAVSASAFIWLETYFRCIVHVTINWSLLLWVWNIFYYVKANAYVFICAQIQRAEENTWDYEE